MTATASVQVKEHGFDENVNSHLAQALEQFLTEAGLLGQFTVEVRSVHPYEPGNGVRIRVGGWKGLEGIPLRVPLMACSPPALVRCLLLSEYGDPKFLGPFLMANLNRMRCGEPVVVTVSPGKGDLAGLFRALADIDSGEKEHPRTGRRPGRGRSPSAPLEIDRTALLRNILQGDNTPAGVQRIIMRMAKTTSVHLVRGFIRGYVADGWLNPQMGSSGRRILRYGLTEKALSLLHERGLISAPAQISLSRPGNSDEGGKSPRELAELKREMQALIEAQKTAPMDHTEFCRRRNEISWRMRLAAQSQ